MSAPMQTYLNPTDDVIEFEVGTAPGSPPSKIRVGPGETVEGPVAYANAYARKGLVPAPAEAPVASSPGPTPAPPADEPEEPPAEEPVEEAPKPKSKKGKKGKG